MTKAEKTFEKIAYTPLNLDKEDGAFMSGLKDYVNRMGTGTALSVGYGLGGGLGGGLLGSAITLLSPNKKKIGDALIRAGAMTGVGVGTIYGGVKGSHDAFHEGLKQQGVTSPTPKTDTAANLGVSVLGSLVAPIFGGPIAAGIHRNSLVNRESKQS